MGRPKTADHVLKGIALHSLLQCHTVFYRIVNANLSGQKLHCISASSVVVPSKARSVQLFPTIFDRERYDRDATVLLSADPVQHHCDALPSSSFLLDLILPLQFGEEKGGSQGCDMRLLPNQLCHSVGVDTGDVGLLKP